MRSSGIYILLAYAAIKINEYPIRGQKPVGGRFVSIQKFPYQVSLQQFGRHKCGGSIISINWVLSAAHCVQGRDENIFSIRAGSNFHHKDGHIHNVTSVIIHTNYNASNADNDVAVLKVKPPFDLTLRGVDSIELANAQPKQGHIAIITGWGNYYVFGIFHVNPRRLRAVKVSIVNIGKCKESLKPHVVTDRYEDGEVACGHSFCMTLFRMLCAMNMNSGTDTCQGDSGGPVSSNGILVGVISWGVACGKFHLPGVYTDVSSLRGWISRSSGV